MKVVRRLYPFLVVHSLADKTGSADTQLLFRPISKMETRFVREESVTAGSAVKR